MKNITNPLPEIGPRPRSSETAPEKPRTLHGWQAKLENHLSLAGRKMTGERYSRALETFRARFRKKVYAHEWSRPEIMDYVVRRLEEGAAVSTVRLELSAIRALFDFMEKCDAPDVLYNPAANVKIPKQYFAKCKKSAPAIKEHCDPVQSQNP